MAFNPNFDIELKYGQIGETHLAKLLTDKKIEVKTDRWVSRSGNIGIEVKCRDKISGLNTSEANYWAFILDGFDDCNHYNKDIIVLIKSDRLKDLILKYGRYKTGMGDDGAIEGWLIPIRKIFD